MKKLKLKSEYRKFLLALIGKYKELPATKNGIEMLIKAYPRLENEKKIKKTYEHLQEMKLARKVALFKVERHNKDTIEITQKGIDVLKENGIDLLENRKVVYERNATQKTKQLQYKIAEADIFFKGALQDTRNLFCYSRDTLIDFLKKQGTWETASQFSGARINGLIKTGTQIFSLYNIKDRNIEINFVRENCFVNQITKLLGTNKIDGKVLLADSVGIIDKTIMLDENAEKVLKKKMEAESKEKKSGKSGLIFSTGTKMEKLFLLLNTVEQQELVKFFEYENFDEMIRTYLVEKNYEKIYGEKQTERYVTDTSFGNIAIYETNKEVGFCVIRQELNYINRLYRLLNSVREKIEKEKRKLVVYGLSCNKALYDKVFAGFPYMEFKEIENEDLLRTFEIMKSI